MNQLCELIAGREFRNVREEACRIEGKADTALNKAITLAADTAVMLKRASVVCDMVEKMHGTMQVVAERQKWQAQEVNRIADYLVELHNWLKERHGGSFGIGGVIGPVRPGDSHHG